MSFNPVGKYRVNVVTEASFDVTYIALLRKSFHAAIPPAIAELTVSAVFLYMYQLYDVFEVGPNVSVQPSL